MFLYNCARADNFEADSSMLTNENSVLLKNYVNSISQYQAETPELAERLQKTKAYYEKIHILKTVQKTNYTVDCIPFAEQPALIDNPTLAKQLLDNVKTIALKNHEALKKLGNNFEFNAATECPFGSVGILRPSKSILISTLANKKNPFGSSSSLQENNLAAGTGGFSYQYGASVGEYQIFIPTQYALAYFKGPQLQHVAPNAHGDHSLTQFWLINKSYTNSVEFGVFASTYFTYPEPTTSFFIYASVDAYGSKSCYNLGCPNFIQAPDTPVLGAPININVDYIFQVDHRIGGAQSGFYLTLGYYDPALNNPQTTYIVMGYYPDSIYQNPELPNQFSVGAEVYAAAPQNGTIIYGNYVNPYGAFQGPKHIVSTSQNGNFFPYYSSALPAPYGEVWHFGQSQTNFLIPLSYKQNEE